MTSPTRPPWPRRLAPPKVFHVSSGILIALTLACGSFASVFPADEEGVSDSRPRVAPGLKPFEYAEAATGIPNYVAGEKWGTQGEPIRRMQKPVAPAESMKHLALPRGFEARLFAAEPDIVKPICMAWDHRGRLWIAESTDYPNDKRDEGGGTTGSRSARTPTATAGPTSSPSSPRA